MPKLSIATRPSAFLLLGPAFVAAVAYVDPGNVAANLTAGARYGYLLLWVLILANAIAVLVQYQSAKLGLVTGYSLPELLGQRLRNGPRRAYWVQAELVAAATDIAEVIGGAVALYLLFGLPLVVGGVIVGVASMLLLLIQSHRSQRAFELVIVTLLGVPIFYRTRFASPRLRHRAAVRGHRLCALGHEHARSDGHAARHLPALGARA